MVCGGLLGLFGSAGSLGLLKACRGFISGSNGVIYTINECLVLYTLKIDYINSVDFAWLF